MALSKPRDKTRRLVLARSGNQCAFPSCSKPIFDSTQLLGQLAHIKGNKPGSARYDPGQNPEERHGPDNLIAICIEHGMLIDDPSNERHYTVEYLTRLKKEHEQKIERTADRSWVKPPNSIKDGQLGGTTVHYWVDRFGKLRIYSDDELVILSELLALSIDISNISTTFHALRMLNSDEAKALLQRSYAEIANDEKLYARLTERMAVAPEITFGEFLHFIVEGGDATPLINHGSKVRLDIIEGRRFSFFFSATKCRNDVD